MRGVPEKRRIVILMEDPHLKWMMGREPYFRKPPFEWHLNGKGSGILTIDNSEKNDQTKRVDIPLHGTARSADDASIGANISLEVVKLVSQTQHIQ